MVAPWVLTKGLTAWRGEINTTFPKRKKDSDGSIGNQAHSLGTSGHNPDISGKPEYRDGDKLNEVRAIDVDKDLANPKFTMEQLIQWLVSLARSGKYLPFRYFIYNGRIWRKATGWKTEKYNGSNKHNEHAHFSGDYNDGNKADSYTTPLGLAAYVKKVTAPPPVVKPTPTPTGLPHYELGKRIIKLGTSKGDDIAHIQKVAGGTKYFGTIDGIADAQFVTGLKRYQRIIGLTADGIAGPKTWAQIKKIK